MPEHILANIDFDSKKNEISISKKISLQLNALSFSLGEPTDIALLDFEPSCEYLEQIKKLNLPLRKFETFQSITACDCINPWAVTKEIELKAAQLGACLKYNWQPYHQLLDSKSHSFDLYKPLFESFLIHSSDDVKKILSEKKGVFVLKTNLNQSGQGHYFFEAPLDKDFVFPQIDYAQARLEKWVDRVFDFSSQWLFDDSVHELGLCGLINNQKGSYMGSIYPLKNNPFHDFFVKHIEFIRPILQNFHKEGFRGHLGVDAFIYLENGKPCLCPLIEINPRKTMGYVALNLSKHFNQTVKISFGPFTKDSILPRHIQKNGAIIKYSKNLNLTLL